VQLEQHLNSRLKNSNTMTLIKFKKPQHAFSPMFPSIFQEVFESGFPEFRAAGSHAHLPSVNISETDQLYHIELSAPGFGKDEITITIEEGQLSVAGEKRVDSELKEKRYTRKEFSYQNFKRSFSLPDTVEEGQIAARFDNGILHIEIPKKETPTRLARKIDLQ
jgi:HSP20 family protein